MSRCSQCGCEESHGCAHAECPKGAEWRELVASQAAANAEKGGKKKVEEKEEVQEDPKPRGFGKRSE